MILIELLKIAIFHLHSNSNNKTIRTQFWNPILEYIYQWNIALNWI